MHVVSEYVGSDTDKVTLLSKLVIVPQSIGVASSTGFYAADGLGFVSIVYSPYLVADTCQFFGRNSNSNG